MTRILLAALFGVLCALAIPACDPRSAQVTAAHALAVAGSELSPRLRAVEAAEGNAVIDAAHSEAEARAALADVEARWAPAWAALATLREAIDAWITALEAESTGDWGALLRAACGVVREAKPLAPDVLGGLAGLLKGVCP